MITKNEEMWNVAEKFAKIIDSAFQKYLEHDKKQVNKDSFIKVVGWIEESDTKKGFVANCAKIIKYSPNVSVELSVIIEMVIQLPLSYGAEDQDISFEMFITLAKFHIECIKTKWK